MMLTTKGRYAVMAIIDIALQSENDTPVSLSDISDRQDITVPYLEQIFSRLKSGNIVKSVRGPGGGYRLSRNQDSITIAQIVDAVNEPIKMTRCDQLDGGCNKGVKCVTHDLWKGLSNNIYDYLDSITLSDVCEGRIAEDQEFVAKESAIA